MWPTGMEIPVPCLDAEICLPAVVLAGKQPDQPIEKFLFALLCSGCQQDTAKSLAVSVRNLLTTAAGTIHISADMDCG
jgi:hypothetical protein